MLFDAVLLLSFGGPEGPLEVRPFLENVTRGRGIPRERLESVAEHYLHFGGVSPINRLNLEMIDALRAELADLDARIAQAGERARRDRGQRVGGGRREEDVGAPAQRALERRFDRRQHLIIAVCVHRHHKAHKDGVHVGSSRERGVQRRDMLRLTLELGTGR